MRIRARQMTRGLGDVSDRANRIVLAMNVRSPRSLGMFLEVHGYIAYNLT